MRELILRLVSSGIGYVGLVLLLRSPDPVRTFALYLPSSILITLAFDRGRGELALREGLTPCHRRRLRIEIAAVATATLVVAVTLALRMPSPRVVAIVALGVSGALQAYVDILLRDSMFVYRRSLYIFLFQLVLASLNAGIAFAIASGALAPARGLVALVALPSVVVVAFLQVLRTYRPVAEPRSATPAPAAIDTAIAAIAFRAFPPAAYTAYATVLARVAPDLVATARAFYFVFGFMHMRTMSREACARTIRATAAILIALTALMALPLLAFASPRPVVDWTSLAACTLLTIVASVVCALFLSRYRTFVNGSHPNPSPGITMQVSSPILVHVPHGMGGVKQVTSSLAEALEYHGREVVRARSSWDLVKARWRGAVRGAILSLETGYLAFLFPRSVYIVHGFPVVGLYPAWKRLAIRMAARFARLGGARLVAVSHLTRAVHEKLFGIPIDAVIFNGCSEYLIEHARSRHALPKKLKRVTYLGRLIDDKRLKTIVRGFLASSLPSSGYTLQIAGSGALSGWIEEVARDCAEVKMLGEINDDAVKAELLAHTEALVSLNEMEPMGIVFAEAILTGCKIVAPYCGGHREFIPPDHPVALCDHSDERSVAAAFDCVPSLLTPPVMRAVSHFSYRDSIAPAYLRMLEGGIAATTPVSEERERTGAAA